MKKKTHYYYYKNIILWEAYIAYTLHFFWTLHIRLFTNQYNDNKTFNQEYEGKIDILTLNILQTDWSTKKKYNT